MGFQKIVTATRENEEFESNSFDQTNVDSLNEIYSIQNTTTTTEGDDKIIAKTENGEVVLYVLEESVTMEEIDRFIVSKSTVLSLIIQNGRSFKLSYNDQIVACEWNNVTKRTKIQWRKLKDKRDASSNKEITKVSEDNTSLSIESDSTPKQMELNKEKALATNETPLVEEQKKNIKVPGNDSLLTSDKDLFSFAYKFENDKFKVELKCSGVFKVLKQGELGNQQSEGGLTKKAGKTSTADFYLNHKKGKKVERKVDWMKYSSPLIAAKFKELPTKYGTFKAEFAGLETKFNPSERKKGTKTSAGDIFSDGFDLEIGSFTGKLENALISATNMDDEDPILETIMNRLEETRPDKVEQMRNNGLALNANLSFKFVPILDPLNEIKDTKKSMRDQLEKGNKKAKDLSTKKMEAKELSGLRKEQSTLRKEIQQLDNQIKRLSKISNPTEAEKKELETLIAKRSEVSKRLAQVSDKIKQFIKNKEALNKSIREASKKLKEARKKILKYKKKMIRMLGRKLPVKVLFKLVRLIARLNIWLDVIDLAATLAALIIAHDKMTDKGGADVDTYTILWEAITGKLDKRTNPEGTEETIEGDKKGPGTESENTSEKQNEQSINGEENEEKEVKETELGSLDALEQEIDTLEKNLEEIIGTLKDSLPEKPFPTETPEQSPAQSPDSTIQQDSLSQPAKNLETSPTESGVPKDSLSTEEPIGDAENNSNTEETEKIKEEHLEGITKEQEDNKLYRSQKMRPEVIIRPQKEEDGKENNIGNNQTEVNKTDIVNTPQPKKFKVLPYYDPIPNNISNLNVFYVFPKNTNFRIGEVVFIKLKVIENGVIHLSDS
jgi:hypothetical protein